MKKITVKWRPPLWMVVGGTLGVVLWLPILGILGMRQMGPFLGWDQALLTAASGVLLATLVLAWMLWRILLRPVNEMRDRLAGLRSDEPGALDPLDHYGTSDMQAMGQSFLEMGRALRARETILRSYADHVTHELKSPLTVVRGASELLASPDLPTEERTRLIGRIEGAADRMTALLDAQRALARAQDPVQRGSVQLSDVKADIDVQKDGLVPLPADTLQLVLDHLIGNAKAHGASQITARFDGTRLSIHDDGTGISEGNAARIFEPFFTTRRAAGGTGMGLSIVRRILEAHEADIAHVPSEQGTRFDITF